MPALKLFGFEVLHRTRVLDAAAVEPVDIGQLKAYVRRVDVLEQTMPASGDDWEIPEMKFIDESAIEECAVESGGAVLHDVLPRLALQACDFCASIPFDRRRIPGTCRVQG